MKSYDFIVVGSGIAGLSFALKASHHGKVLVITKSLTTAGSTGRAQGGIASVMAATDSISKHIEDTLLAGAGLCKKDRVKILVSHGPSSIKNLVDWGVRFSKHGKQSNSDYHLAREGGHSDSRILHAEDLTGKEILRALLEEAKLNSSIIIKENFMAIDLITDKHLKRNNLQNKSCYGVYALNIAKKKVETFVGASTILCTGGVGQVYAHTTNDEVATADGLAMAFRAGVKVEDMEFMQFHPTSLYDPRNPTFLISEALRGHGGILRSQKGVRIMENIHKMKDLAPRDIVARAIDAEMKKSGTPCVYLDMTPFPKSELINRFPNIYSQCLDRGINIAREWIPVVPAAHFMCGGIQVDDYSATCIPGLYACGEVACTGVHGANRLASNSLLEAIVFSERALDHILKMSPANPNPSEISSWDASHAQKPPEYSVYTSGLDTIKSTMWNYVGIVRSNLRLDRARDFIDLVCKQALADYWSYIMEPHLIELRNLALAARLIVESARRRKESRGLHYNINYKKRSKYARHTVLCDKNTRH